jgi:3-methylfumaryl-CoA hydratase
MLDIDIAQWIGKTDTPVTDTVTAAPCAALSATLDRPADRPPVGTPLPPLWHWLYFLPLHARSDLGPDGHPKRGGFLPPVALPRRMWGGRQFDFISPIRIGDRITRTSTIVDIRQKHGRTGPLVFVKLRHDVRRGTEATPAIVEFQDIIYRDAARPGDTPSPPSAPKLEAHWRRRCIADDVLLFRFSALTFNAHRIHYDRRYATDAEGYPGLVVQGPLTAMLLLDLLREMLPDTTVRKCEFRALRPLYDNRAFDLCGARAADGKGVELWAVDDEGWVAMEAAAELA